LVWNVELLVYALLTEFRIWASHNFNFVIDLAIRIDIVACSDIVAGPDCKRNPINAELN
jgi:hypothetical protein